MHYAVDIFELFETDPSKFQYMQYTLYEKNIE